MKKPTGRAPLLSDDEFKELLGDDWIAAKGDRAESAGKKIRDFYEAKITSGELRVVDNKPTERSLLSDEDVNGWIDEDGSTNCCIGMRAIDVRNWYEAKITSGELRVVKKATWILIGHGYAYCSVCPYWYTMDMDGPPALHNFCPGCGAQIVKE